MTTVALISGSGGSGKTVTALTLALAWADRAPCWLIDTDSKDAGSACSWLDRAQPAPPESLTWAKATRPTLLDKLGSIEAATVIDTAPGLDQADTIGIAEAAGAVLVTGSVGELLEIAQAVKTIQAANVADVAVVFTRTPTATDRSALGLMARQAVDVLEVPVLGSLRQFSALARAKVERRIPSTVADHRAQADAVDLVEAVDKWLGGGHGQG